MLQEPRNYGKSVIPGKTIPHLRIISIDEPNSRTPPRQINASGEPSRGLSRSVGPPSDDLSRDGRHGPSDGSAHPSFGIPFPYPGNAPPPFPPLPPSFVVPMIPLPINYNYVPAVPPAAHSRPQLPLWPTPAVPSILLQPAVSVPASVIMWEPGTFPPSPLGNPVPLCVHPHILYNPISPFLPALQWDIVLRPEQARVLTGKGLIKRPSLDGEAVKLIAPQNLGMIPGAEDGQTNGVIEKIWIESETPVLAWWMQRWGPIIIEKSDITIRDVLDAIQAYLSVPLTEEDYTTAVGVQTHMDGVNYGNGMRLRNARRLRASNGCELRSVALRGRALEDGWSDRLMGADPGESSIYRRSDVLGTYRRFLGLRPVASPDSSWKLLLGLGLGPVPKFS
ncbi:hypothetical protein J3R30DRAFT_46101 [Lentinula aciculospora]|uniref:DUF6699 domain-containing protein n=1 Tax=Lentinula aciculospora TaxID=153920 RepID=A0A9W9ATV9_9AGAR|nr:hypothetical protein J3R30DRAFT_46101 [Lentinula aciculospora]